MESGGACPALGLALTALRLRLEHRLPVPRAPQGREARGDLGLRLLELASAQHLHQQPHGEVAVPRARHLADEPAVIQQRTRQGHAVLPCAVREGLGHHSAGVRVRAHCEGVLPEEEGQAVLLLVRAVLQEVLHHEVGVDVLRERDGLRKQRLHHAVDLVHAAMLQQALQCAAAVLVPRQPGGSLVHDLVDDELGRLGLHGRDELLQHVVGVAAARRLPDAATELEGERLPLVV
mmetsp:Transcript_91535/g.254916  ORF Transcript_91535/g.254916 Transcript_91535/m.254916 type:complete len:234 (-) Transcript_91535:169-870(-)